MTGQRDAEYRAIAREVLTELADALHSGRIDKHEDSSNCYWDAQRRGNGLGRSWVHLNGKVYYRA